MRLQQHRWTKEGGWSEPQGDLAGEAQLLFVFASPRLLADRDRLAELSARHPKAVFAGCSTAGEIQDVQVSDDTLVATAVRFEGTTVEARTVRLPPGQESGDAGRLLAQSLPSKGLRHVIVLSEGTRVNGSALVAGMMEALPKGVQVTGGLAGDGDRFERTIVLGSDGPHDDAITAVGLYGDRIRVGLGSLGGWDPFGPRRRVTRSGGTVLFELDGEPALAIYKKYLGDQAAGLPATGLLFPLSVQMRGRDREVVRTILGVNEEEQSMTFAGDIPEGAMARLMKANFDRLVDGAQGAAEASASSIGRADLALLISCVGRKLVLKQRVEEELEAVRHVLGPGAVMTGFYSYGEICPAAPDAGCELHNQTMTITTLRED